jgi:uncharacterized protein YegP (UPF0339 family)
MSAEAIVSDLVVWKHEDGEYRVWLKSANLCLIIKNELVQPASQSQDDVYDAILSVVEQHYAQLLTDDA